MKANRDGAGDVLLRLVHRDLHEVELRREPHSIVDQLSRLDGERVTDPVNLFIIKLFIIKVSEVFSHKVTQNKKNESARTSRSIVRVSRSRCALCKIVPPGVS